MGEEKAKVKETAGYVTGDREVEAEGRAEREAVTSEGSDQPSPESVEHAEDTVRAEHGDV